MFDEVVSFSRSLITAVSKNTYRYTRRVFHFFPCENPINDCLTHDIFYSDEEDVSI